ncbi:hypothetical protein [Thiomicrorhabdus aquaedulcis]|uniref:hypothetical protein n=1 Tax=Thiomicrorhabdus aquaedulcis TaxID=2211106 RepID=UPI000FD7C4A3|nr:hypothetical protein [Thiomicrorhabdus aquaedulcis]
MQTANSKQQTANSKQLFKLAPLTIALSLALTACGGGGGSGGDAPPTSFSATTSGAAAKGILSDATVTAVELNANQTPKATLATATTNAAGTYALTIPASYTGQPIKITVTSTANTQMKCDVVANCGTRSDDIVDTADSTIVNFGEWYKPGAGAVEMNALIAPVTSGATLSTNVTPFTHMAASRAFESPTLDATAINNANSEVNNLLGFNVLNTQPIDITAITADATPQQIAYAALSAAIGALATKDTTSGVPDLKGAIEALATQFADGQISAADLGAIATQTTSTFNQVGKSDESGVLSTLNDKVTSAGNGGNINPEPSPIANVNASDKAKAFVSEFRTYATSLDAAINKAVAGSFVTQVEAASALLESFDSYDNPLEALNVAKEQSYELFDQYCAGLEALQTGTAVVNFTDNDQSQFQSGSVTYTYSCNDETGVYTDKAVFKDARVGQQLVNVTIESDEEGNLDESGTQTTYSSSEVYRLDSKVVGTINSVSDSSETSLTTKFTINDGSALSGTYVYEEDTSNDTYTSSSEDKYKDVNTLNVTYEFTKADQTVPIVFTGEMAATQFSRDIDSSTENSYSYSGQSYLESLSLDGSAVYGAENVTLKASLSMPNSAEFRTVGATETATNYLQASASLGLTVDINDLKDVKVNLSAQRTSLTDAKAQLNLQQGARSLLVDFNAKLTNEVTTESNAYNQLIGLTLEEPTSTVTVTNLEGVKMVFVPNLANLAGAGTLATVTIDGVKAATVERTKDDLIKTSYVDGTFEIF